jgi:hypothetical protein
MNVVATPEAENLIRQQGGRLFVWADLRRCCGGATYLLSSFEPRAGRTFRRVEGSDDFELYVDLGRLRPPQELQLGVRGRRRQRVEAYWNGCVFVS